ncbi:MAG TPA: cache domain-containing protein [Gallionellaceae bacterium]
MNLLRRLRTSIRSKLLALVLLPLLLALFTLLLLSTYGGYAYYQRLLDFKVISDLAVADQYFHRIIERVGKDTAGLAESNSLVSHIVGKRGEALQAFLDRKRAELQLDFLRLVPQPRPTSEWPVLRTALKGKAATAIDIFSSEHLAALGINPLANAYLPLVPTPNAAPTDRTVEKRGMVIHTAAPVFDEGGKLLGVLEGGMLLNQNLGFVDDINALVYRPGTLLARSEGTATLFLDDVRIATNVRLFEGQRALGTRVSQSVRDKVLGEGKTWYDRAFVVKDWYISAYEPILNSRNQAVGMLYVGYLERPYRDVLVMALSAILLIFAAIGFGGIWLAWRWARSIFTPLEQMNATISAVESGDMHARTGNVESDNEIGRVARHLDMLLDLLNQRSKELEAWGNELDRKVAERTLSLQEANDKLLEAQRQLVMAEKLAAIGEITASVAHEINNPVAVIQGNLDVLRDVLGKDAQSVAGEIALINQQVNRIQLMVTKLLQFARPTEYAGYVEAVDVNQLLEDSLILVRHQFNRAQVAVVKDCATTCTASINRNELQQVMINLIVNALHAMPHGGTLTLATRTWGSRGVQIMVGDTGVGIAAANLGRIFDPFYSTKKGEGTGLGLSISYTLVARYGGTIAVSSEADKGSTFTVDLPAEAAA